MNLPGPVPYTSNTDARIAVIGESPGDQEIDNGVPFYPLAPAGFKLQRLLESVGWTRADVRLMNCSRYQPPGNKFGYFWKDWNPPKNMGTVSTGLLADEVALLDSELSVMPNLKIIIACGRNPTYILTGKDGIGTWRGSLLRWNGITIIPTYHPSLLARQPEFMPISIMDFQRAKRELGQPTLPKTRNYIIYPTREQIERFIGIYTTEKRDVPLSLDIETPRSRISRLGMCGNHETGISIPFYNLRTGTRQYPELGEWIDNDWAWEYLRPLLRDHPVIGQNFGSYDRRILEAEPYRCPVKNLIWDTMTAQHCILPGLPEVIKPYGLAFLSSIYCRDHQYYKDENKKLEGEKFPPDEQHGIYNLKDCFDALEVQEGQKEILEGIDNGILPTRTSMKGRMKTFEFEMDILNRPIQMMMENGIRFDRKGQKRLKKRAVLESEYLECMVSEKVGYPFLLSSDTQVRELLFEDLGMKTTYIPKTDKKKVPKVDEDALKVLKAMYPENEILDLILMHRKIFKLQTGILAAKSDSDGRMRCTYRQATDTGRLNTSESPFGNGYPNHTVPRKKAVRSLYLPGEGMKWVKRDLSKAESWITYYEAEAEWMLEQMRQGKSAHQLYAQRISGKRYEDVGKGTKEYSLGKAAAHASDIMIGSYEFSKLCRRDLGLHFSRKESKDLIEEYFEMVPEVRELHKQTFEILKRTRTLTTPLGRTRVFFGRLGKAWDDKNSRETLKKAVAYRRQSTIGDLLNIIILRWLDIRTTGKLLGLYHDESGTCDYPENIQKHLRELDRAYGYRFDVGRYKGVTIPWDTEILETWGG